MAFEYLAAYQTFQSVAEMDEHVEYHIQRHYFDLTPAERAIVFKLASHALEHTGACHLKAATIAQALEISTKTVYRSIKRLAELGIIQKVPGTKLNGIKGASIYKILPFDINVLSEVSQRETTDKADSGASDSSQSEKIPCNSFKLFKQASNIISAAEQLASESEKKKEFMNEWQINLYDLFHSLPIKDELKDQLHNVVLASGVNDFKSFVNAKDVLLNIIRDINSGVLTVSSTLRAVFGGTYEMANQRLDRHQVPEPTVERTVKPVPFYNWLVEREGDQPSNIERKPQLENWLLW